MRHFAGILLGIVLVPVFFALNWAVNYTAGNVDPDGGGWWLVALLGAYAAVGLVTAIFLASRSISPMALLLGGLLIAAVEVLLFLPRLAGIEVNIPRLYDYPEITNGFLLVAVGAALVFGGFFPTRWHRKRSKYDDEYAGGVLAPAEGDAGERGRDSGYDASWGSGRNDYAEEPETPYVSRSQEPSTQQMPVTQPGEYDRPPAGYDPQVSEYDQQALGYSQRDTGGSRYEDPPTSQYEPPTIHDPYESQPARTGYDDRR